MKKLLTLLMAAILMFAMTTTAFADESYTYEAQKVTWGSSATTGVSTKSTLMFRHIGDSTPAQTYEIEFASNQYHIVYEQGDNEFKLVYYADRASLTVNDVIIFENVATTNYENIDLVKLSHKNTKDATISLKDVAIDGGAVELGDAANLGSWQDFLIKLDEPVELSSGDSITITGTIVVDGYGSGSQSNTQLTFAIGKVYTYIVTDTEGGLDYLTEAEYENYDFSNASMVKNVFTGDFYAYNYEGVVAAMEAAADGATIVICDDIDTKITIDKSNITFTAAEEGITLEKGIGFYSTSATNYMEYENVTIDGFTIPVGLSVNLAGYQVSDLTISNNDITGQLLLADANGSDENPNPCISATIINNTVTATAADGVIKARNMESVVISGNTVYADVYNATGIMAWYCEDAQVYNNTIVTAQYAGINVTDTAGSVLGNTILEYGTQDGTQYALIFSQVTDCVVTGNNIAYIEGEGGIKVQDGSYIDATGNTWNTETPVTLVEIEDGVENTLIIEETTVAEPTATDNVTNLVGSIDENTSSTVVNATASAVVDEVSNVEAAHEDETLVESVNTLDALFVSANDYVTVDATVVTIEESVATEEEITVSQVEGLAVAYYGNTDTPTTEATAATLSLTVTQKDATEEEADVIFTAKPQVTVSGNTSEIANEDISTPITFNVYLPDTFTSNYAKVEHIFENGGSETLTCKVLTDDDGKNYIRVTVSEFSEFQVTQYQVASGSVKKYSNSLEVGDNGSAYATPLSASSGTTVYINVSPDTGYEVDEVLVDGGDIDVTDEGDGTYSYKQPSYAVDIEVTFAADGTVEEVEVEEEVTEEETEALTDFEDVVAGAWYEEFVATAVEEGIMQGNSTTEFAPNGTTTRAMMIQVLFNLEDQPETENDESTWYSEALAWGMEFGITDGSDITGNLTREQLVTMLYRYAMSNGVDTSAAGDLTTFGDAENVADWAADAFAWAVGEGIINGDTDGNLNPDGNATRAELAKIMVSYLAL